MIVDGASYQSSTEMAETLMGPEDLAGGSCRRCNVRRARSFVVHPVVPALACRRRGIIDCVDSGLDRIASEVSDLARRGGSIRFWTCQSL